MDKDLRRVCGNALGWMGLGEYRLNNLQRLRLKVNDGYRNFGQMLAGDGEAKDFDLLQYPVKASAYTAYIDGVVQHETADYSLSTDDGRLTFVNVPADNASIRFVGQYSTFSDTELGEIMSPITTGATAASFNDLDTPLIQCVEILIGDAYKRASWAAAGGQSVNESTLFNNLITWRTMLLGKYKSEIGPDGSIESWAENQSDYPSQYEG